MSAAPRNGSRIREVATGGNQFRRQNPIPSGSPRRQRAFRTRVFSSLSTVPGAGGRSLPTATDWPVGIDTRDRPRRAADQTRLCVIHLGSETRNSRSGICQADGRLGAHPIRMRSRVASGTGNLSVKPPTRRRFAADAFDFSGSPGNPQ